MSKKRSDADEVKPSAATSVAAETPPPSDVTETPSVVAEPPPSAPSVGEGAVEPRVEFVAADLEVLASALATIKSLGKRGLATKVARLKDKISPLVK